MQDNAMQFIRKKQIVKVLSGNAFKVFYTIFEMTIRERHKGTEFNGWIQVSHNQLKSMTGVQSIFRVVDEFKQNEDIITMLTDDGIPTRYKIAEELINERLMESYMHSDAVKLSASNRLVIEVNNGRTIVK